MLSTRRSWAVGNGVLAVLALCGACGQADAVCPQVGFTIVAPHATPETRAVKVGHNKVLYVHRDPITRTAEIAEIKVREDGDDDASLLLKFTAPAAQRLHDATTNHSGRRIAFMLDDEVLNNVVWQGPYGLEADGAQVSIAHGLQRLRRLVLAIHGCTAVAAGG